MSAPETEKLSAEWSQAASERYRPGAWLGRYELLLPVGSGGMAAVWIARLRGDAGFTKLVALKVVLPHLAGIDEVRRMLHDEARIAARVHHPNVVAIQELGTDQGVPYVVMEWLDGVSLDQVLSATTERLDPRLVARIVADACAGLHAAHEITDDDGQPLCVVHRDISPYNLLVSLDGAVKVADFGIAKARGQLHRTDAGGLRGRVSYMAPEQVNAQPLDRRADVFAVGATLHELLTGELAFPGENQAQIIAKINDESYRPPGEPIGAEAVALFAIARRALSRSPPERFQSAEAMRLALEAWLAQNAPPVITSASIAALVRGRVGAELERRRVRLRQALHAERDPLSPLRASGAPPERLDLPGETMAPAPVSTSVLLPPDRRPRTPAASAAMLVASALILVGGWVAYSRVASGPAPARPLVLSPAPIPPAAWNTPTRSSVASAPAAPPSDNGWVAADSSPPEAALVEAAPLVTVKSTSAKEPAPVPAAQRVASPPLPAGPKASGLRSRPGDGRADEIPANPY